MAGYSMAPPATQQPEPVPAKPRHDGLPYASPLARRLARDQRIDLRSLLPAVGSKRVRSADIAEARRDDTAAAQPLCGTAFVSGQADVTSLSLSAGDRPDLIPAVVVVATRQALRSTSVLPPDGTRALVRHVDAEGVRETLVMNVETLSAEGAERMIGARCSARNGRADFMVLVPRGLGLRHGAAPPPEGHLAVVSLGEVFRSVVPVRDAAGQESFAIRSLMPLTISYDPDLIPSRVALICLRQAMRLLETWTP